MYQLSEDIRYEFRLVGEGSANCVFEIRGYPPNEAHSFLQGNLLRVAKAGTKGYRHEEVQEYWESVVRPLFRPEDLVRQQLVKLGGRGIIARLNAVLAREESRRRADFRGSRVAEAEYGMLVEDMRQKYPGDLTLEFKPKWLAQSPSAPRSATRCRNCAREVLKHHTKLAKAAATTPADGVQRPRKRGTAKSEGVQHEDEGKIPILCPLNFLDCSASPQALATLLAHLLPRCNPPAAVGPTLFASLSALSSPLSLLPQSSPSSPMLTPPSPWPLSSQHARLAHWLQTNTLLPRLRAVQVAYSSTSTSATAIAPTALRTTTNAFDNPNSDSAPNTNLNPHEPLPPQLPPSSPAPASEPHQSSAAVASLALAMTLRDCTCFVRVPADPSRPVEAKLADLDRKRGATKMPYWREMERRLLEGGFYEGREVEGVVTDCVLERKKREGESLVNGGYGLDWPG